MQDNGARQQIDKGVDGARHMVDKQAQGARQDFNNKVKTYLDVIRLKVQDKRNKCARPRCKKQCTKGGR